MKSDYLWDKTGEPDPEIVRLEELLGTLRYQPRQFDVPATKRSWYPLLAIAAMISMAVIAAGLWLSLNRQPAGEIAALQLPVDVVPPIGIVVPPPVETTSSRPVRRQRTFQTREQNTLTVAERKEAEAVKEQLMFALRLASSKLSLAQKKAQGAPAVIRNQHKLG